MNVILGLVLMAIFIAAAIGLTSITQDQLELSNVIENTKDVKNTATNEMLNIKAQGDSNGNVEITNTSIEDIEIIQFRVYYDDGTLKETYSVNQTIPSHDTSKIVLPSSLQEIIQ